MRDFLFGLSHIPAYGQHPCVLTVFLFATLKGSEIFRELLLITAFPSEVLFSVSLLVSSMRSSAAPVWFWEITVIRKTKHPPGLSFIGSVFNGMHCLWQLALRNGVLGHRPCLYCMLTDNSLWGHNSAATQRHQKDNRKDKPQKWAMRNSMFFNSFGGITLPTSKGR